MITLFINMDDYLSFIKNLFKLSNSDPKLSKDSNLCMTVQNPETNSFSTQASIEKKEQDDKHLLLKNSLDNPNESQSKTNDLIKHNPDIPNTNEDINSSQTTQDKQHLEVEDEKTGPDIGFMDWKQYHRLEVIHDFMHGLEDRFPAICTVADIGKSLEKRDLKVLKISNSISSNASVWMDAGIHAREWIAPAVATYVANHIANNFDSLPEYMTNKDWYFLPVVNPDGYEYTHTNERMWRKNKAKVKEQYYGVDLNRNFSFGWGGRGSSDIPNHAFYRGPKPFSEPESCAMRDMILNSEIAFKVYITLHSFGQVIIFPLACSEQICPDYIRLLQGATVMSKAIYKCNGNTYKVGISKDVMYPASGTSNDWSYGEAKIPYCYLIELRSKKHRFKLPKEEIAETGIEILNCIKALMEFVDSYPLDSECKEECHIENTSFGKEEK